MNLSKNEMKNKTPTDVTYADSRSRLPTSHIPGWGIDAPEDRRVGVPKNGRFTAEENGVPEGEIVQQKTDAKIFVTIERPKITPVFGTTYPPKLLSGKLRTYAYTIGESKRSRWLTLILADRVDVVENIVDEFFFGQTMPGRAKKVRPVVYAGVGVFSVAAVAGLFYLSTKSKSRAIARSNVKATPGERLA